MSYFKSTVEHPKTSRRVRAKDRKRRALRLEMLEDRRVFASDVLDPTFGIGGYVRADFGNSDDYTVASALDSQNRTVVAGYSYSSSQNTVSMALARFQPNGTLDASFGSNGKLMFNLGSGTFDYPSGLRIMDDGRILVAGQSQVLGSGDAGDMAIVRLLENGQFDTSFNGSGKQTVSVTTSPSSGDIAKSIFVTADGSIIVTGEAYNDISSTDFVVVKLSSSGQLDESFGTDGKLVLDLGANDLDNLAGSGIQSDGKIVLAGYSGNSLGIKVARVTHNGVIDTSFGASGFQNIIFRPDAVLESARAITVQSNDDIVLVGSTSSAVTSQVAIARLTSDGELDPQFNATGKQIVEFPEYGAGTGVAVFEDGRIRISADIYGINAGAVSSDVSVVGLTSQGQLDSSFSAFGKASFDAGSSETFASFENSSSVLIQPDGKSILVGSSFNGNSQATGYDFLVARVIGSKVDQSITFPPIADRPFSPDPIQLTASSTSGLPITYTVVSGPATISGSVLITTGVGNIVVSASQPGDENYRPAQEVQVAFKSNTAPVAQTSGPYSANEEGSIQLNGAASYDSDGAIVSFEWDLDYSPSQSFNVDVTGVAPVYSSANLDGPERRTIALRVTDNLGTSSVSVSEIVVAETGGLKAGELDLRFGTDGVVVTNLSTSSLRVDNDVHDSIIVDGKTVVAGVINGDLAITRYLQNGDLDTSFGSGGTRLIDFGSINDNSVSLSAQADGKIVVLGNSYSLYGYSPCLVRLNNDGSLDSNFDLDGKLILPLLVNGEVVAQSLAIQADGRILLTGSIVNDFNGDRQKAVVARLQSNGSLDTTFGMSGVQVLDIALPGYELTSTVQVQSNGNILVAGVDSIIRLNNLGALDTSFANAGKATIPFDSLYQQSYQRAFINDFKIQSDGRLVFAGRANRIAGSDMVAIRLTENGDLDQSFGVDGFKTVTLGLSSEATSVVIDTEGKILLAGVAEKCFGVVRLNSDGSLDTTFDGNGKQIVNVSRNGVPPEDYDPSNNPYLIEEFGVARGMAIDAHGSIVVVGNSNMLYLDAENGFVLRSNAALVRLIGDPTPTDIQLSASSTSENLPSGSMVGSLATIDPNVGDAFFYTLVPGDGDADNASFTIDGNQLFTAASFDFETKSNYSIRVRTTDLTGLSFEKNLTVTIIDIAESIPPVIGAFDTAVLFTENGAAVVLDANATITDADSLDFVDGVMTVSLIANSDTTDRLLIRNVGTGVGQIGVIGNQITFAGNPIATFIGGTAGDNPLVVTFGAGGTKAAAQALLRNLTFSSVSDSPSILPRTVQVVLTDGDGGESLPVTKTINVTAVNDAPVIANFSGVASYTEGDSPVILAPTVTISDVDSADFATGILTVRVLVNSQTTDRLSIRNDGIAPGDIGVSGTNVLYGNVVIGSFTGTTTLTVTLNANANAAAVQALLRNVTFQSISLAPSTSTRTISATLTDGDGGTSATATTLVNVVAVNSAPVIGAFDTTVTYAENAAPVLLDTNATVSDVDSLDFSGGILSATLTDGSENSDRLAVRNQGIAANQVGVIGNQLSFGGTPIGTIFGGTSGSDPLQVVFNANASPTAVQAVLRNITFNSVSQNPSTLPRTVEVQLTDGDGGTSDAVTKTINVTPVNNAPVVGNFSGVVTYTEGDAPVLLAATASVFDVDSADFDLGRLTVSVSANSQTTDRVTITNEGVAPGQIGVSGTTVTYGGIPIGTFTGTTTLIVTLNASASQSAVEALVSNIAFSSLSAAPSTLPRTISASLTDGDGGTSATVTKTVQVFTTNNDPVIGAFDTTVTYVENGLPVILDTNATVTDPDLVDFEDGVLTVSLTANSSADDRLEIRNQGTGANQIGVNVDEITFGGVVIGTFSGGTSGSEPLEILFNVSANQAAIQALVRNFTFRNVSEAPSNLVRSVSLTLTDGDGGTSAPVTKLINVTAVNDAPVISNFSGTTTYTEDDIAVAIAIDAVVDDLDSADFDLGRLIASVSANSQTTDRITIRNDGIGAGQIGVSGTNVTYSGVVIGTFAGTTTLTVTLNAAANKAAVQALLRNISFSSLSGAPSTLQRTITATLSDGDGGTSLAVSTIVEVIAVNDAPVIGAFTPDITYVENAAPLLIDSNATVTDVDSLDFADGFMTIGLTANGHVDDRLSIRNQGIAANQIGVTGNQITYSGVPIGSFVGGTTGLIPLQITFNGNASKTAVQALVRNLTYSNVSDNPSTLPRTVSLVVNDGDGGSSIPVTKIINVTAVNDAPTIGNFGGNVGYAVGGPAVVLDSDATVDDPDNGTFNLGVLTVALTTNRQATDRIEIQSEGTGTGQISVLSNQVFYEGVLIGTFGGTTTLSVTLNANASKAAVQKLLRSITFRSLSATPSLLPRTVSVSLSDGAGGTSVAQTKTIDMV